MIHRDNVRPNSPALIGPWHEPAITTVPPGREVAKAIEHVLLSTVAGALVAVGAGLLAATLGALLNNVLTTTGALR
jgi:hypothetical protein